MKMIKVKVSQIYNNQLYYSITKNKMTYSAFGAEQAIIVIKDIRKDREKVDVESIDPILEEHSKLIEFIKSENKNRRKK